MCIFPVSANNNNDEVAKRRSLVVTLEDGTVTETLGTILDQRNAAVQEENSSGSLSIQEVEPPIVRMVPIKLEDEGKMIQKEPEESMQIKAEFTNFTHQEFSDDKRKFFFLQNLHSWPWEKDFFVQCKILLSLCFRLLRKKIN